MMYNVIECTPRYCHLTSAILGERKRIIQSRSTYAAADLVSSQLQQCAGDVNDDEVRYYIGDADFREIANPNVCHHTPARCEDPAGIPF